jgi:uncharacterized phage infection (PIP) family protein YhgE
MPPIERSSAGWIQTMIGVTITIAFLSCPSLAQDKSRAGVDAQQGIPVIDPTENVKALNEAANKRQDDLRELSNEINTIRYNHIQELVALRADYEDKLRRAEANRLDAIRLVDTNNVAVANERAVATATALAKTVNDSAQVLSSQVTKSADDLRTLVATTAAESSRSLQQQFAAITTRVSALEQGSVNTSGVGSGRSDVVGWAVGALMLFIAMGTMAASWMRKPGK